MRFSLTIAFLLCACGNATPPPATTATSTPSSSAPSATPPPTASTAASNALPEAEGQRAAEAWLADVDAGRYAESWTAAATLFRGVVDQPGWVKSLTAVRAPLGAMKSRKLRHAQFARSLPGAPDGEYVVVQFDTVFEKKDQAVETVTPMKDTDGRWHVSGYFIK